MALRKLHNKDTFRWFTWGMELCFYIETPSRPANQHGLPIKYWAFLDIRSIKNENNQVTIQSDPISCPRNQMGIIRTKNTHGEPQTARSLKACQWCWCWCLFICILFYSPSESSDQKTLRNSTALVRNFKLEKTIVSKIIQNWESFPGVCLCGNKLHTPVKFC